MPRREIKHSLEEFGKPEYKDPIVPVNMLMVLMGFSLLLFNNVFENSDDIIVFSSSLFGAIFLIGFMLYVSDYHEKIWEKYFSLPEDRMFFRFYGIITGIIVISAMNVAPEYWCWYIVILFFLMYFKKKSTKNSYEEAFYDRYGKISDCDSKIDIARLHLAGAFTTNFLLLGLGGSIVFAVFIEFLKHNTVISGAVSANGITDFIYSAYFWANATYTLVFVGFWVWKIRTNLNSFVKALENENVEFFEQMRFGS